MSGKTTKDRARKSQGMKSPFGPAQSYKNKDSKGEYARGAKKGARRGRRRLDKEEIKKSNEE